MLSFIPNSASASSEIIITDYACLAEKANVVRPQLDAAAEEFATYREKSVYAGNLQGGPLTFREPRLLSGTGLHYNAALAEELGFNLSNIDISVEAGWNKERYLALGGSFDVSGIRKAAREFKPWEDDLSHRRVEGFDVLAWGKVDGYRDFRQTTPVRPEGVGHRLAVTNTTLLWADAMTEIEDMIDAGNGDQDSVLNSPALEDLVRRLEATDFCSAYLATDYATSLQAPDVYGLVAGEYGKALVDSLIANDLVLAPYQFYGIALGVDASGAPVNVLVLAHSDESMAGENALRIKRILQEGTRLADRSPWSSRVRDVTVKVDGAVVEARFKPESRHLLFRSIDNLDTPFIHE